MTFLITGAGRGLGLEFTRQLLLKKNKVIAWVREPEKSKELLGLEKEYSGQLQIQKVEITKEDSIAAAAAQLKEPVDVLINNAGILLDSSMSLTNITKEALEKTFAVNVIAPIQVIQKVLPSLQKSSAPMIVNVSSLMGSIEDNGGGGYYAYRASKTAVNMVTKTLSRDFPKIKVLSVHPGWVQTDMGGANATTSKPDSIAGLIKVIENHKEYDTGAFVNFTGEELPW